MTKNFVNPGYGTSTFKFIAKLLPVFTFCLFKKFVIDPVCVPVRFPVLVVPGTVSFASQCFRGLLRCVKFSCPPWY